jgi:hypothetical protein
LTAQGVGPRGLRAELRARVALASALGVCVGLGIAVLLTRLAIATVGAAGAVAHPRPPLVTVVPWLQLAAWGVAMFAVLVLAGGLAAQSLIRNEPASPHAPVPLTEGGRTLSEGIVR